MSDVLIYILMTRSYFLYVVYFSQLLGAARTQKLVKLLFFSRFQPFLFISNLFQYKLAEKDWNQSKTDKKR